MVWIEKLAKESIGRKKNLQHTSRSERTIMIRVIDRKRVGSHRTSLSEPGELDGAVRAALAQSRSREPLPGLLHFSAEDSEISVDRRRLLDPGIARLSRRDAEKMIAPWVKSRGTARLRWTQSRVAVLNSRGIRRKSEVTAASVERQISRTPGAGRAAGASRFLSRLKPDSVCARARDLHVTGELSDLPELPAPVVLAPEAAARLIDILNRVAFSAISYYSGSSFLREHLDVQVFDRSINLRDDAHDPRGLPFPFDLEGSPKRPIHLILKGSPKTPALDQRQAALLGLTPTGHAIGGSDARAMNLFLEPGPASEEELLREVDRGIWIGWLDGVECYEPSRVQIRATARSVRRIEAGRLSSPISDLVWEDSLLRAFANLIGIASSPVQQLCSDGTLGGISSPSMAFGGVTQLRPVAGP